MKCGRKCRKHFILVFILTVSAWTIISWRFLDSIDLLREANGPLYDRPTPLQTIVNENYNAHLWKPVKNTLWCRSSDPDKPGLIYVKIPKTASSTLAGINMRIARKVGERTLSNRFPVDFTTSFLGQQNKVCTHTKFHGRRELRNRKEPALVWTFLRDPAKRAISDFYHFQVSRKGVVPTNAKLAIFLENNRNYQWNYIADCDNPQQLVVDGGNPHILQNYVFDTYHFIGLVERKDESLAVMKLLWGLNEKDLIVLSAKKSGQYDDGRSNATCTKIQKPRILSNFTKSFLSNSFRRRNFDFVLYDVINRSLDYTIQVLGRDVVQKQARRIRDLERLVEDSCMNEAIFPCSANGTRQHELSERNCYLFDSGCGYQCVDRVLTLE